MAVIELDLFNGQPTIYEPAVSVAGTQDITIPLLSLGATIHQPGVGQPTTATGASAPQYVLKMVTMTGSVQTTLTNAIPERIVKTLNEPDQAEFSFPRNAYTYSQIPVLGTSSGVREVQFYRDDDLLFWGPVISADTNAADGQVACACAGVDWYLNRRALEITH
jgi:hypothetical protein